jgi:hypothetical protein
MKISPQQTIKVFKSLFACLLFCSCASNKVRIPDRGLALSNMEKKILIFPPIAKDKHLKKITEIMGRTFYSDIPKLVDAPILYAKNIPNLEESLTWENLMKDGELNINECLTIAKTTHSDSIFVCEVLDYKKYPPFKMVVNLIWIETKTGKIIAQAYNNVDMIDEETVQRFASYAGNGSIERVYEFLTYRSDIKHSASLSPTKFVQFVSAHSTELIFDSVYGSEWHKIWNIL